VTLTADHYPLHSRHRSLADHVVSIAWVRATLLSLALLWLPVATTLAEAPVAANATAELPADDAVVAVTEELAAAREKLAADPSSPLARMVAEGVATPEEQEEWTLLLSLRIASLEKHLDALRGLEYEIQSRQEVQAQAQAWTGFAQAPPYSIEFIDELWANLIARQQDIEAVQIPLTLASTQIGVLRRKLDNLQQSARQAAEQARVTGSDATPEQARLNWLSELARERVLTTLATLAQYETTQRLKEETLARLRSRVDFLQRQIAVATKASPLTQAELDGKLASNAAKRLALEMELEQQVKREPRAEAEVGKARAELAQRRSEAKEGNADDQARIEHAQDKLDVRKAQAETAMLQQEALRLLLDATRGTESAWRYRFELAHQPGLARLREMRELIAEYHRRIALWKRHVANSLDAATGLIVAAEQKMAESGRDGLARDIAKARVDTYREREALYKRLQAEIKTLEMLLLSWEHEVLAQDRTVSPIERFKDLLNRVSGGVAKLWNLELFAVTDSVMIEGREVTGVSSITVGKIVTVLLILTLGVWLAALLSKWISLLVSSRLDMNKTVAALLERGLYIATVIALALIALDIVNIPLTVFAFLGGALAIGIGFGAQNLINNFISGLILLAERPISLGDLVEVEGVRGRVRNIGARCSQIRRADGIDMLVPNSVFLERNVTNLTLTDTQLRVSVKIGVAYGSPLRDVTRLLEETVQMHGKVLKDPVPLILFEDFGDNSLMFSVEFWVNVSAQTDSRVVASDLRFMIERVLREAGIVIAFPQRDVHLDQTRPLEVLVRSGGPAPEQPAVS
jgi:potassium-dependent mechanosensitive channel